MNTQAGKSIGIALLLAAGLLAALFAMGVFAPAGAEAGVKSGGGLNPTASLVPPQPGLASKLVLTFYLNEEVDGSLLGGDTPSAVTADEHGADAVLITFSAAPRAFTIPNPLPVTNVTVRQNGVNVGKVFLADEAGIVIGRDNSTTGANPNIQADVKVTVEITGLTNVAASGSTTVTINQGGAGRTGEATVTVSPIVTNAYVTLNNDGTGEDVDMTLSFRADTASAAGVATGAVIITIPSDFDLDGDSDDDTTAIDTDQFDVKRGETAFTDALVGYDHDNDSETTDLMNALSVTGFAAKELVTLTIKGKATEDNPATDDADESAPAPKNPGTSKPVSFTFAQSIQEPAVTVTKYVTDESAIAVGPIEDAASIVSSDTAGEKDVTMEFQFTSIVNVSNDNPITITLDSRYGFEGTADDITIWQDVKRDPTNDRPILDADDNEIPIQVDFEHSTSGGKLVISLINDGMNPDPDDATNTETLPVETGQVMVRIEKLTNPGKVGAIAPAVTVQQGSYAAVSYNIEQTGTEVSTTVAGEAVRVKVSTKAANDIPPGEDILVKLPGFVLPATIDEDQVILDGGRTGSYYGEPSSVTVSGTNVTLSIPTTQPNGNRVMTGVLKDDVYTITFKLGAGLKNPTVKRADRSATASDLTTAEEGTDVRSKVSAKNAVTGSRAKTPLVAIWSISASSVSKPAPPPFTL